MSHSVFSCCVRYRSTSAFKIKTQMIDDQSNSFFCDMCKSIRCSTLPKVVVCFPLSLQYGKQEMRRNFAIRIIKDKFNYWPTKNIRYAHNLFIVRAAQMLQGRSIFLLIEWSESNRFWYNAKRRISCTRGIERT
mmetsp:Transcript_26035/g.61194  ORF Transcript_26035/g.61194 Transcript_26035/m.61194 type:complete len:134 (-) Transcript_26035:246-647(-)